MIITLPKFADALDVAKVGFVRDHQDSQQKLVGGFLMVSYIMQALNLKDSKETIIQAVQRLREQKPQFDLLSADDREMLSAMLYQMFAPLGVHSVVLLGITDEALDETGRKRVFVTMMRGENEQPMDIEQVKHWLRGVAESEGEEGFEL